MLASVADAGEARLAMALGADVIDAKSPASGALGALPHETVREIVAAIGGRRPVSATIGDLPLEPASIAAAVVAMAETGVDYVKMGLFAGDLAGTLDRLRRLGLGRSRLVAVLLADRGLDLDVLARLAQARFAGVMLDTAGKAGSALPEIVARPVLSAFITGARRLGLLAGLAGSLRERHVAELIALGPDLIGFRGALCKDGLRSGKLDPAAFEAIRALIADAAAAPSRRHEEAVTP
jgi:uncharacterized protein (UPF0264 family)